VLLPLVAVVADVVAEAVVAAAVPAHLRLLQLRVRSQTLRALLQ
jgi:hypothetical protein